MILCLRHANKMTNMAMLLVIALSITACGSNSHAKSLNLPVMFESVVKFELDGQPITLTKRYC